MALLGLTVVGIDWRLALLCVLVIALGAAIQATIGLGMALLAAPFLALIDPAFIPVTTVVMVWPLSIGVARREFHDVAWADAGLALAGRLPGVIIGSLVVASTGTATIHFLVGISVLVAVATSVTGYRVTTSRRNLLIAGLASGFSGTAAGIGGPPMAIAYQHARPSTTRATLAVFFGVGAVFSFTGLLLVGAVERRHLLLCLLLLPGVALGLVLSRPLISRLPEHRVRLALLSMCSVSAVVLLTETLIEMR